MITTAGLFTSPEGFGVSTATPAQLAAGFVIDGIPMPAELREHSDVVALVGGREALAELPSERGIAPAEVVFLAAIRCGKTMTADAAAIRMTQTVDLSGLGPGEIPRVSIVSLKLDVAAVPFRMALETIRSSRELAPLLLEHTSNVITLRHPSGRPIELAVVAGSAAGGSLVARWCAGAIFDEAPRMGGAEDGVVNLDHARAALAGRMLPGAQVLMLGSPWAPHGPVYELVEKHWRKPSEHVVVLRGTGPMLNPFRWTPEACERLLQRNPVAYQTDVIGEFADPESGLLSPVALQRCTREGPLELPFVEGALHVAAVDVSEGLAGGNGWTLCIVQQPTTFDANGKGKWRVALAREWRGVGPEQCWREIAELCALYGVAEVWGDQYAASANVALARQCGVALHIERTTAQSKLEDFTNLATIVHAEGVELPPHRVLRNDLLSVKRKTTQTGTAIHLPHTADGRHCDFAPAVAAAVKRISQAVAGAPQRSFRARILEGLDARLGGMRELRFPLSPAEAARRAFNTIGSLQPTAITLDGSGHETKGDQRP